MTLSFNAGKKVKPQKANYVLILGGWALGSGQFSSNSGRELGRLGGPRLLPC